MARSEKASLLCRILLCEENYFLSLSGARISTSVTVSGISCYFFLWLDSILPFPWWVGSKELATGCEKMGNILSESFPNTVPNPKSNPNNAPNPKSNLPTAHSSRIRFFFHQKYAESCQSKTLLGQLYIGIKLTPPVSIQPQYLRKFEISFCSFHQQLWSF